MEGERIYAREQVGTEGFIRYRYWAFDTWVDRAVAAGIHPELRSCTGPSVCEVTNVYKYTSSAWTAMHP